MHQSYSEDPEHAQHWLYSERELQDLVYDLIRVIKDPERPENLEDLNVVYENGVKVEKLDDDTCYVTIEFTPTVTHCHLATLIGLCLRVKVQQNLPQKHKIDIFIREGTHDSRDEITKQINDKERVAAALENPNLKKLVEQCICDNG